MGVPAFGCVAKAVPMTTAHAAIVRKQALWSRLIPDAPCKPDHVHIGSGAIQRGDARDNNEDQPWKPSDNSFR